MTMHIACFEYMNGIPWVIMRTVKDYDQVASLPSFLYFRDSPGYCDFATGQCDRYLSKCDGSRNAPVEIFKMSNTSVYYDYKQSNTQMMNNSNVICKMSNNHNETESVALVRVRYILNNSHEFDAQSVNIIKRIMNSENTPINNN